MKDHRVVLHLRVRREMLGSPAYAAQYLCFVHGWPQAAAASAQQHPCRQCKKC